jgi:uncharacterized membrane-anchored protein YjiN (DUF445 family)
MITSISNAKRGKSQIATIVLVITAIGTLATFPFRDAFWIGLLYSGFVAATIGGLADWFAVTALFRHPLGIRWPQWMRTQLIPRRKQKLFEDMVYMLESELLTKKVLKDKIRSLQLHDMIVRYLEKHGGRKQVIELLEKMTTELIRQVEPASVVRSLEGFVRQQLNRFLAAQRHQMVARQRL